MSNETELRQRIVELEEDRNRHKKFADVASTEYHKLSQEAARLREALEVAAQDAYISAKATERIHKALAGAKGVEDAVVYTDTQCADVPSDGGVAQEIDSQKSRAGADTSSEQTESSPTPLSEPLELDRLDMDCSYSIADVASILNRAMYRIERRDAEIAAAIAEVRECNLVELYDYIKAVETRVGKLDAYREVDEPTIKLRLDKMQGQIRILDEGQRVSLIDVDDRFDKIQEQISAQADLQDEMQVAIDQIRSVQAAANGIYYEMQRDDIRPMQERLDALTEAVDKLRENEKGE